MLLNNCKPKLKTIGSCNLAFVKSLDILDMLSNFHSQNVCRHLKKFEKHFSIAMLTQSCFADREREALDDEYMYNDNKKQQEIDFQT